MTRPAGVSAQWQISVEELIRRVRAENSAVPAAERVPPAPGRPRPDHRTRRLLAGAAVVTALSVFALVSFVVAGDPGPAPAVRDPAVPGRITFAGTRTGPEKAAPPPPTMFSPPYGGYPAPAR